MAYDDEQAMLDELQNTVETQDYDPSQEGVPESTGDPRLEAALSQRNQQRMYADLLGSFQQLAGAGAAGTGYKPDMSLANKMSQRAEDPMTQYKALLASEAAAKKETRLEDKDERDEEKHAQAMKLGQINIAGKQLDLTDLKKTGDAGSEESAFARAEYKKILTQAGEAIPANIEKMSAKQIHEESPAVQARLKQLLTFNRQKQLQEDTQIQQTSERLSTQEFKSSQSEKDAAAKLEAAKIKANALIKKDLDKDNKIEEKERGKIATENRKQVKVIDKSMTKLEELKVNIKDAIRLHKKYAKESWFGTGAIATVGGMTKYLNQDQQMLDSSFQKISLANMSKMFEGMSKAVDSDAERAKFEASQPALSNDDAVNLKLLEDNLSSVDSLINKNNIAKSDYLKNSTADKVKKSQKAEASGEVEQQATQRSLVKKAYNPKSNKTQFIYSDGSKEIVEGKQ